MKTSFTYSAEFEPEDIDTRIDGLEAMIKEVKEATVKKTSSKK